MNPALTGHDPVFPNHIIGHGLTNHQGFSDLTPSAHKRKHIIKIPVVANSKMMT